MFFLCGFCFICFNRALRAAPPAPAVETGSGTPDRDRRIPHRPRTRSSACSESDPAPDTALRPHSLHTNHYTPLASCLDLSVAHIYTKQTGNFVYSTDRDVFGVVCIYTIYQCTYRTSYRN